VEALADVAPLGVVRVGAGGGDEGHVEAAADVEALAGRDELRRLAVVLEARAVDGRARAEEEAHAAVGGRVEVAVALRGGARRRVVGRRRRRQRQRGGHPRRGRLRRRRRRQHAGRARGRRGRQRRARRRRRRARRLPRRRRRRRRREAVADAEAVLGLVRAAQRVAGEGPRREPDGERVGAALRVGQHKHGAAGPGGPARGGARVKERQPGRARHLAALVPRRLAGAGGALRRGRVGQQRRVRQVERHAGDPGVEGARRVHQRGVGGLAARLAERPATGRRARCVRLRQGGPRGPSLRGGPRVCTGPPDADETHYKAPHSRGAPLADASGGWCYSRNVKKCASNGVNRGRDPPLGVTWLRVKG